MPAVPAVTWGVEPTVVLGEAVRLGAALVAGGALGLNRNLRGKAAGLRTHALVSLGAAVAVIGSRELAGGDITRTVQGVITGIGFIGAGVILHPNKERGEGAVRGLTTAASVWVAAALGITAGAGLWSLLALATAFTLGTLMLGGRVEQAARRRLARQRGLDRLTPAVAQPAISPEPAPRPPARRSPPAPPSRRPPDRRG